MNKIWMILALLLSIGVLPAQYFGSSTGNTSADNAIVRNTAALDRNPANLAFNDRGRWEINLFSFNIAVANSSLSLAEYNRYFTEEGHGGSWSDSESRDFIDRFPEDGLDIIGRGGANALAITYGPFGFSTDIVGRGDGTFKSRRALELLILDTEYSLDFEFNENDFVNGDFFTALRYNFAYGHKLDLGLRRYDIDDLAVGGRLRIYSGLAYGEVVNADVTMKRINSDVNADGNEVFYYDMRGRTQRAYASSGSAGSGVSLDFAASATYDNDWDLSLQFENLVGSITWDQNAAKVRFRRSDSIFVGESNAPERLVETDTVVAVSEITTPLPASMTISAAYRLDKSWRFMGSYRQGFSNRFAETTTPLISLAAEYRVADFWPLRLGTVMGGLDEFLITMQSSLEGESVSFDTYYAFREALWPSSSNGLFFGLGLRIRI